MGATSIFSPSNYQAIAIPDQNFTSGDNPPSGWQLGGPGIGSGVTISYDDSTGYLGQQSLILSAASGFPVGISTITPIPCAVGQQFTITVALYSLVPSEATFAMIFLDASGNVLGTIEVNETSSNWAVFSANGIAPPNTASAQFALYISGPTGGGVEFAALTCTRTNLALDYYTNLLTSEYKNQPNLVAWLRAALAPFVATAVCAASIYEAFNVFTAAGSQLDAIGTVVGVSRNIEYIPPAGEIISAGPSFGFGGGYAVGDILNVVQVGGSGGEIQVASLAIGDLPASYTIYAPGSGYASAHNVTTSGGTGSGAKVTITVSTVGSPVYTLDDPTYRILLLAKIAQNQFDGQIDSLYAIWDVLFPGGTISVIDNMDMTATIILTGTFTPILQYLITSGQIVPRPQGVLYNYIFGQLPIFGFDTNGTFIAGFDTGYWA